MKADEASEKEGEAVPSDGEILIAVFFIAVAVAAILSVLGWILAPDLMRWLTPFLYE